MWMRPGKDATPAQWFQMFKDFETSSGRQTDETGRAAFIKLCEITSIAMQTYEADLISQLRVAQNWRKEIVPLIRAPFWGHAFALSGKVYRSEQWCSVLAHYPDVFSIGRLSRISCWYSMLQASNIRKVKENDFEDTAYAHAASYTGFLATEDCILKDMVSAVFENVTVISRD